MFTLRCQ
jgi:hypothetical protein